MAVKRYVTPHRHLGFWIAILVVVVLLGVILHEKSVTADKNSKKRDAMPVVLAPAVKKNVPIYLNGLGSVTPTATITVRTQINGTLLKVLFNEGQYVKAGDLLAQVDPRPYEAQLTQYQGQLLRDQALLANAQVDLKRYQTLWKQDSVSQQTLATQQSLVQQYQGAVQIDQGLIDTTKINLIYCNIIAPVDGRIGLRLIDPGNYVQTSDTNGIAVVTALNPITVIFSLPEDQISDIAEQMNHNQSFSVEAYNRDQTKRIATGKLITIDNQIDPTTGTVRLRAQFNNDQQLLFPNQFVNAKLLLKTLMQATVIPTAAIQYGVNGSFVYLFNPQNKTVNVKNVKVSTISGDDSVIREGVAPGQSVVVQGADNLTDGAEVKLVKPIQPATVKTLSQKPNKQRELA